MFLVTAIMLSLVIAPAAQGANPLNLEIDGPVNVAQGEPTEYTINATGGPAENGGNYSYSAKVLGTTPSDARLSPSNGTSSDGTFRMNLTAKGEAEKITIQVNMTSQSGDESVTKTKTLGVTVVDPITISAVIENTGKVKVNDVPVTIYADGEEIHSTTVDIDSNSTHQLNYNWTAPVGDGRHEIRVVIDPDHQLVTFEGGGQVYTSTIYLGEEDYGTWNIALFALLGFLIFLAYTFYRRPAKKRKR
ncbi:MAG: CARDB domain-containing protein [Methanomassiliicoccales archaeon]